MKNFPFCHISFTAQKASIVPHWQNAGIIGCHNGNVHESTKKAFVRCSPTSCWLKVVRSAGNYFIIVQTVTFVKIPPNQHEFSQITQTQSIKLTNAADGWFYFKMGKSSKYGCLRWRFSSCCGLRPASICKGRKRLFACKLWNLPQLQGYRLAAKSVRKHHYSLCGERLGSKEKLKK